ncbi:hypothetical protein NHQ30_007785 [Ciborinia camelliae]|nr:hypothetical protein NHQ30_007785 [Ciborinia camelliae]
MLDTRVKNQDCGEVCKTASRNDGSWRWENGVENGVKKYGTQCWDGGNYECATWFEQSGRARCV